MNNLKFTAIISGIVSIFLVLFSIFVIFYAREDFFYFTWFEKAVWVILVLSPFACFYLSSVLLYHAFIIKDISIYKKNVLTLSYSLFLVLTVLCLFLWIYLEVRNV